MDKDIKTKLDEVHKLLKLIVTAQQEIVDNEDDDDGIDDAQEILDHLESAVSELDEIDIS